MRKLLLLVGLTFIVTISNSQTLIDKEVVLKWNDGNTNWITSDAYSHIFTTGQVGSAYPFQTRGNLVLQPRAHSATDIVFGTGATPTVRMVIKGNGNVGIGKIPTVEFDVLGFASFARTTSQNQKITIEQTAEGNFIKSYSSVKPLIINANADNNYAGKDLVINSSHQIGIGKTPTVELDVLGFASFARVASQNQKITIEQTAEGNFIKSYSSVKPLIINANSDNNYTGKDLVINHLHNVGIGTSETGTHKLAVDGTIGAREIVVETGQWSDFVFSKDYELKNLEEVESFIEENKHLPDIPSEREVLENGVALGEMDAKLLQKIEELTLYMIEQNKETKKLIEKVEILESENTVLKEKITKLETAE